MQTADLLYEDLSALLDQAERAQALGAHATVEALCGQVLEVALVAGEADLAARARVTRTLSLARRGELEAAVACGQAALTHVQVHGPPALHGRLLVHLSLAFERSGLKTLAAAHADQALALARESGDRLLECHALIRLATAEHAIDAGRRSQNLLQQALVQARALGADDLAFSALNNAARLWVVQADHLVEAGADPEPAMLQAHAPAQEAATLAQVAGHPSWRVNALANLGGICRRLRQTEQARHYFQSALTVALEAGERAQVATLKLAMACLEFEAAPSADTCAALEVCLSSSPVGTDPELQRQARHTLVQGCRAMNDLARALSHMETLHRSTMAAHERQADLQARLLFFQAELAQVRHQAERAELDAEVQRLRADAASRAKALFLGVAGHELRTPLNGVLGMLELARHSSADPALNRRLDLAVDAGRGLAALVSQLLEFVAADEADAGAVVATDLRALLQTLCDDFQATGRGRALGTCLHVDDQLPPRIMLDVGRAQRVLQLLLDNALKFATGGPIAVAARWRPGSLRLEVSDAGPGITDDVRERLFQLFEPGDATSTRSQAGLGLGLALARRLVVSMGGTLGVATELGRGSTFYACWPADAVQLADAVPHPGLQGQPAPNSSSAQAG